MANYAYVENNIPLEFYDFLPKSWRNISGLNLSDENYLRSIGWYKIIKNEISYDSSKEIINGYNYKFENNNVYETPILEKITEQPVINIPEQISATQIRLWLIKNNISLSNIEDAINSIEDSLIRNELMVKWEYVPYFERNNPFVNQIGNILGLSSEQIDQAFIEAANY